MKAPKPLPLDSFAAKYDKPENRFYNIEVSRTSLNKEGKVNVDVHTGQIAYVKTRLQIVILPDDTLRAREV